MGKKNKKSEPEAEKQPERALTPIEKQAVDNYKAKYEEKRSLLKCVKEGGKDRFIQNLNPSLSNNDAIDDHYAQVYHSTGCADYSRGLSLLMSTTTAILGNKISADVKTNVHKMNQLANGMRFLQPKDEIEGQLISQLMVLHEQSMHWFCKAAGTDRVDFANTYINASTKLINRYHETLKTLMRYRQGGDQKIIIENVTVNDGGRAIVGQVTGAGLPPKNEDLPHAKM